MNPSEHACHNPQCSLYGQADKSNIVIHSQKEKRLKCTCCKKTFSHRKGSAYENIKKPTALFERVCTLLAFGCPYQAIVAAYDLDERTVRGWHMKAGRHAKHIHNTHVVIKVSTCQVQADEFCGRIRGKIQVWCAMALIVSSRLWLGCSVSASRNKHLIYLLMCRIKAALPDCKQLLLLTDGLKTYKKQFERAFREKVKFERNGRVHWRYQVPDQISLLQLVKSYSRQGRRYLCKGVHKIVLAVGEWQVASGLLKALNTTPRANTSYIERLNATFRTCLAAMGRRTRNVAHHIHTVEYALWLKGTTYNFCAFHRSLSQNTKQTPAMAQGIIDRKLRVKQLLAIPKNAHFLNPITIHDIM